MKPFEQSLGSSPTITGTRISAAETLGAGTVLGNYRIVRLLGAGGMGAVYLAEHTQLKTRHALKTIRPEFAKQQNFAERFQREAKLATRLKHPHIVACTETGVAEGTPYLVMDYIEGPAGEPLNLRQLLDQRREHGDLLGEDEAAAVGLEICKALDYAHSYRDAEIPNGIIHRDLKPANILLDKDTKLYIADFGLARLLGEKFEESVVQAYALSRSLGEQATLGKQVSVSADTVGTFDYMSPEQREGRTADARSDVFALGAILYELFTGRKVVGVPSPPSMVQPGLNPVWDEIILERALAYEPEERYASAGELALAIEHTRISADLAKQVTSADQTSGMRTPSVGQPTPSVPNPNKSKGPQSKVLVNSLAFTVVLVVVGFIMWLLQKPESTSSSSKANIQPDAQTTNFQSSFQVLLAGAEGGDTNKMFTLGYKYEKGEEISKDEREAVRWYRRAAELGHALAMNNLGLMYTGGKGVSKDEIEAVKWFRKAADAGEKQGMCNLGVMCSEGRGIPKDEALAVAWYRKAAELGHAPAMCAFGSMSVTGRGVPKDETAAVRWYRKAADLGNADAMHALGVMCEGGRGIPKDDVEAVRWLRKAAELDHTPAMCALGLLSLVGRGVSKDEAEAVKWYRKAADLGNADAMNELGVMYEAGRGIPKDEAEAVKWYRKAAELSSVFAMKNMARMYTTGKGVPLNEAEAIKWHRKAAELGYALAIKYLGSMQNDSAPKDEAEAVQWYRKAAELEGKLGIFNLGNMYATGRGVPRDEAEAVKWYRKAADLGNAIAMNDLGFMCDQGKGVPKDEVEAVKWFHRSAGLNYALAMKNLGGMYAFGRGVPRDEAEAVKWYRKAADLGNADAMTELGFRYEKGRGVLTDDVEAVRWYRKAAELGHALAMNNLGWMYENGFGVPKDRNTAIRWYDKAAALGDSHAHANLQRIGGTAGSVVTSSPLSAKAAALPVLDGQGDAALLRQKLQKLIIPRIEIQEANIVDVLNFLRETSASMDTEGKTGVNFILAANVTAVPPLSLRLRNVSLLDTLKYITDIANLSYRIDNNAVIIMPRGSK